LQAEYAFGVLPDFNEYLVSRTPQLIYKFDRVCVLIVNNHRPWILLQQFKQLTLILTGGTIVGTRTQNCDQRLSFKLERASNDLVGAGTFDRQHWYPGLLWIIAA
jgi:hypothetical protein